MQYLILAGGNIGDTGTFIREAWAGLEKHGAHICAQSALYRSEAWGFEAEQSFINAAVLLESDLDPETLLQVLLQLENDAGRTRSAEKQYISRTLDLDILLAGNLIYSSPRLQIPHPRLQLRRFALVPAAEIMPGARHPRFMETLAELLQKCPDQSPVSPVQG